MSKTKIATIGEEVETKKAGQTKAQKARAEQAQAESMETAEDTEVQSEEAAKEKTKDQKIRGKNYVSAKAKISRDKLYAIADAIKLIKETSYSKFDGSVELHAVVRKQGLSTTVTFPHSFGKEKKVEIANDETIENLKKGKIDYDILLATPDMMPKLAMFAKVLGPKGLMPNPKKGTLIKNVKEAEEFSTAAIAIKTEKEQPVIHTVIGKVSMTDAQIKEHLEAIMNAVGKTQFLKAYLVPSMGPSIKLQV